jgi:hypothetical protein
LDFDELFLRSSLVGQPIAVLLRPHADFLPGVEDLFRWQEFLSRVSPGPRHSVTLWCEHFPQTPFPARRDGVRLRAEVTPDASTGEAFGRFVRSRSEGMIAWVEQSTLPSEELWRELLGRVEHADIVSIRRRRRLSAMFAWPWERLARSIWGVPFADPFSPITLFRREAIAPLTFQTAGAMLHWELAAKATYLVRLIDEVSIPDRRSSWARLPLQADAWRLWATPDLSLAPVSPPPLPRLCEREPLTHRASPRHRATFRPGPPSPLSRRDHFPRAYS